MLRPRSLRAVHRDVGVLQQLFRIVRVVGIDRDADRRRDEDVVLLDLERLRDRVEQLLRDAAQHRRIVEVLDDHHELVAAQARQQVGLAQRARQRGRHALQELVADAMAERVVDVLEAVEVDEQHADAMAAALGLRDRLRQALVQQQPVGQAGQRVARREILQPLLGLDPRRHVLHERQDRHDLAVVVEQRRVVPLAPDRVAVAAVIAREAGRARLLAAHEAPDETGEALAVVLVHERAVGERNAQDLVATASRRCSPPAATSARAGNRGPTPAPPAACC